MMPETDKVDQQVRLRRVYVLHRLPALREEIKAVNAEKRTLDGQVKSAENKDSKNIKQRRMYLIGRMQALRNEQKALLSERQTGKTQAGKTQPGGTKLAAPASRRV